MRLTRPGRLSQNGARTFLVRQNGRKISRQLSPNPGGGVSSATLAQSTSAALHVELIQDASHLAGLSREWFDLWSALPDVTPFQSPHWLLPWWAHYGQHPMLAFAFRSNEKLVALAPLYIYQEGPSLPRRVFLMGTGNSDYLDLIVHPKFHSACS